MTQPAVLKGDALHALFERAWALLNMDDEDGHSGISEAERKAAVGELVNQHTLAPANMPELTELYHLWMALDAPKTANAALHQHRETALSAHNAAACAALEWELMELDSRHSFAPDDGAERLAALAQAWHRHALWPEYRDKWMRIARQYQVWQALEAQIDRDRQQQSQPGAEPEALLDAIACWRKAELAHERGDQDALMRHFHAALARMDTGGDKIEFVDWKVFANKILEVSPQHVAAVLHTATPHLIDSTPPPFTPVRRYRRAHFARLHARAQYALGQLQQALASAQAGCFDLDDDASGHTFAAQVMQWHLEAGNMDKAAELALQGVLSVREGWALPGYALALKWCEQDTSPLRLLRWWCILAWAQMDVEVCRMLQQGAAALPAPPPPLECLARAREHAPEHPLPDLLQGIFLARRKDWPAALALLERGVPALPELANPDLVLTLWAARLIGLPVHEAIARPFPHSGGADWCASLAITLDSEPEDLLNLIGEEHLQRLPPRPALDSLLRPLAKRYFQEAIARYEAFFASGQGHYKDASPNAYAIACNNLGILHRLHDEDIDAAIILHHKGIAACPFAEQYDNLLSCAVGQYLLKLLPRRRDHEAFLEVAESVWQHTTRGGSVRPPPGYFGMVADSLAKLGRSSEISIWMDRLHQWYDALDPDERQDRQQAFVGTLVSQLFEFSAEHPGQARIHLNRHLPAILALADTPGTGLLLFDGAHSFERCDGIGQALSIYRLTEARLLQDLDHDPDARAHVLTQCEINPSEDLI